MLLLKLYIYIKLLKLSCNVSIKKTFCKYFAGKLSPDNDPGYCTFSHEKRRFYPEKATRILTMWHMLPLSIIPPAWTQHVFLKLVSNLS